MSMACKFERSLLSHDEYETVGATHHPAIFEFGRDQLHAAKIRLRAMRDKEGTLARQKRREARGKADPRGGSFPGTAERPLRRKQIFAAAVQRVNKELHRIKNLEARAFMTEAARRALKQRRAAQAARHPGAGDTADPGMHSLPNKRRRTKVDPGNVGRISQATKVAQAVRDSGG
jgi:hypothetical protein